MAVEKSAVREDTRWNFRDRDVEVVEVTARRVIVSDGEFLRDEAVMLDDFLAHACEPGAAEHRRIVKGLRFASHKMRSDSPDGELLALLRDAALYQLERMSPATPVYVAPVIAPKPAPVEDKHVALAMPDVETTAYALADDRCEVLIEDEAPSRKRRFS